MYSHNSCTVRLKKPAKYAKKLSINLYLAQAEWKKDVCLNLT